MDEIDPDEVENIAQKTDDMKLTEDQTQTLSYQEQFDENFNQTIPDPTKIWEFLWNDLDPSFQTNVPRFDIIRMIYRMV